MTRTDGLYTENGAALDETDKVILSLLSANAKIQNAQLAAQIALSPSATLHRVRRLEEGRAIRRYVAEVNESIFAFWTYFFVRVELHEAALRRRSAFEDALKNAIEVIEVAELAGRADYLLKCALPTFTEWPNLCAKIDPDNSFVREAEVTPAVKTIKYRSPHPLLQTR